MCKLTSTTTGILIIAYQKSAITYSVIADCLGAFKAWKQPPVLLGVEKHFSLRIKTSMV